MIIENIYLDSTSRKYSKLLLSKMVRDKKAFIRDKNTRNSDCL